MHAKGSSCVSISWTDMHLEEEERLPRLLLRLVLRLCTLELCAPDSVRACAQTY
jgi:hypothetical protein